MPVTTANFTFSNTTSYPTWLNGVNALAGNELGAIMLLVIWLAVLITLKSNPWARFQDAFAVASFVTWIAASLFIAFEFVSITLWAISLSLTILGGLWLWFDQGGQ